MRKLCRSFAYLSAVIALFTVPSCCKKQAAANLKDKFKFELEIGKHENDFADVGNTNDLELALKALKTHGGKCYLAFMDKEGKRTEPYGPCTDLDLKTAQVITSPNAKKLQDRESTANDPNITYRVRSNEVEDMKAVVATLTPSPNPTSN